MGSCNRRVVDRICDDVCEGVYGLTSQDVWYMALSNLRPANGSILAPYKHLIADMMRDMRVE